jgi:membrane protein DedA with SNARE-associated domain
LLFGLAVHVHHHFKGAPIDYAGLALASGASWVGLPGPGEPVLIAAGILAAKHKLDLASVLLVAFAAAWVGGMAGWAIGLKAGRALLTARGPLRSLRLRMLASGDQIFQRYVAIAVFVAPSFASGIYGVRPGVYVLWNTFWALVWTVGIGLGAYYAGPPIVDLLGDIGWFSLGVLAVLILAVVVLMVRRRRGARLAPPNAT